MSWFEPTQLLANQGQQLRVAQITDCHLFANEGLIHGVDSYEYLSKMLAFLAEQSLDLVIFTGDMTQDHSDDSFYRFADCYRRYLPHLPCYWLPGNHDELEQLAKALHRSPFYPHKHLVFADWHLLLLNSKSTVPSGEISPQHFAELEVILSSLMDHHQVFCFCHHHPLAVGAYIDRHGLVNGKSLVKKLLTYPQVKGLAHGHIHQFHQQSIVRSPTMDPLNLYGTAATSIQFPPHLDRKETVDLGPAYRLLVLNAEGSFHTKEIFLQP